MAVSESGVRRLAHRNNLRVNKFRESDPFYVQYGPYAVADARTSALMVWQLWTLEDVRTAIEEISGG
ncbi:hypothetical protein [Rhodococcus koreensis]|uniref:hypothetical protein n=1 Tax=Rhodococcus koreensis TaxID=99653 RepID=UPI0036DF47F1